MFTHFNEKVIYSIIKDFHKSGRGKWSDKDSVWVYPATLFGILNVRIRDILFSHLPSSQPSNGKDMQDARGQLAQKFYEATQAPIRMLANHDCFISILYSKEELSKTATTTLKNILMAKNSIFHQPGRAFYYINLVLSCRYLIGYGTTQDLNESLSYLRSAVKNFLPDHHPNAILARNLAAALFASGCHEALLLDAELMEKKLKFLLENISLRGVCTQDCDDLQTIIRDFESKKAQLPVDKQNELQLRIDSIKSLTQQYWLGILRLFLTEENSLPDETVAQVLSANPFANKDVTTEAFWEALKTKISEIKESHRPIAAESYQAILSNLTCPAPSSLSDESNGPMRPIPVPVQSPPANQLPIISEPENFAIRSEPELSPLERAQTEIIRAQIKIIDEQKHALQLYRDLFRRVENLRDEYVASKQASGNAPDLRRPGRPGSTAGTQGTT